MIFIECKSTLTVLQYILHLQMFSELLSYLVEVEKHTSWYLLKQLSTDAQTNFIAIQRMATLIYCSEDTFWGR